MFNKVLLLDAEIGISYNFHMSHNIVPFGLFFNCEYVWISKKNLQQNKLTFYFIFKNKMFYFTFHEHLEVTLISKDKKIILNDQWTRSGPGQ